MYSLNLANDVETVKVLSRKLNAYGLKTLEFHKQLPPSLKEMYLNLFKDGKCFLFILHLVPSFSPIANV